MTEEEVKIGTGYTWALRRADGDFDNIYVALIRESDGKKIEAKWGATESDVEKGKRWALEVMQRIEKTEALCVKHSGPALFKRSEVKEDD